MYKDIAITILHIDQNQESGRVFFRLVRVCLIVINVLGIALAAGIRVGIAGFRYRRSDQHVDVPFFGNLLLKSL